MEAITTENWIVLGVIFAAGLILGLILRSGGSKWRRMYDNEHSAHLALRRDYDAHIARHADTRPVEHDTLRSGSF